MHRSGGWDLGRGCQLERLPVASPCGLGFPTAWQLVIKSKSRGKPRCLYGLAREDIPLYLCHILLVRRESPRPTQIQENRNKSPPLNVRNDNEIVDKF